MSAHTVTYSMEVRSSIRYVEIAQASSFRETDEPPRNDPPMLLAFLHSSIYNTSLHVEKTVKLWVLRLISLYLQIESVADR